MPKTKIKSRKIKVGVQYREVLINREHIDEESRSVDLSFSSAEPIERFGFIEILGHGAGEVRLSRLQNAAPLLFNHNRDSHLGVIDEVSIDSNESGRAVVRFGTGALASEKFEDVKAGILTKVSVGYIIHREVLEEMSDDQPSVYRVVDWEPLEVSLVTIPADDSVGVGRTLQREYEDFETTIDVGPETAARQEQEQENEKQQQRNIEEIPMPKELTEAERAELEAKARTDATAKETLRCREIIALGEQYGASLPELRTLATKAVKDGDSLEAFRGIALEKLGNADAVDLQPASRIGLNGDEANRYSIIRAINAHISGNWDKAGFERECHEALDSRLEHEARGFLVPYEVQVRKMGERAMTAGGAATGAELVGTEHLDGSFIDNLRAQAILGDLGAIILPGLVGNIAIPKKTSSASFAFVAEDATSGDTNLGTGTLSLTPKILAGGVAMSRSLLKQSAPQVEQMAMNDLALGAALGIDLAGLRGSGAANNPTGIINTTGVLTQAIADAVNGFPTWAELVGFETTVAAQNGLGGVPAYATTAQVRGSLKTTVKDSGSGRFLLENGLANESRVAMSTQLTAKDLLFGNFAEVIIAMWGTLDILPDTATKVASGGLVIRVFADMDVGVRQPTAFCKNA